MAGYLNWPSFALLINIELFTWSKYVYIYDSL